MVDQPDWRQTGVMIRKSALVTGASAGIGSAFARRLAPDHDVLLVARSQDRLTALRDELIEAHPDGRFEVVVADLSDTDGLSAVVAAVRQGDLPLDLLVNNAGSATHGAFLSADPDRLRNEIMLDCAAVVTLTRELAPAMVGRRRGGIINVGSLAGFQPVPALAVYAAAKAFVISFSEAIREELRGTGVRVGVVCPGTVETSFFDAAGAQFMTNNWLSPDEVVTAALAGLVGGGGVEIPGRMNKVSAFATRLVPLRWQPLMARWVARARD